jgi:hypothetical protein
MKTTILFGAGILCSIIVMHVYLHSETPASATAGKPTTVAATVPQTASNSSAASTNTKNTATSAANDAAAQAAVEKEAQDQDDAVALDLARVQALRNITFFQQVAAQYGQMINDIYARTTGARDILDVMQKDQDEIDTIKKANGVTDLELKRQALQDQLAAKAVEIYVTVGHERVKALWDKLKDMENDIRNKVQQIIALKADLIKLTSSSFSTLKGLGTLMSASAQTEMAAARQIKQQIIAIDKDIESKMAIDPVYSAIVKFKKDIVDQDQKLRDALDNLASADRDSVELYKGYQNRAQSMLQFLQNPDDLAQITPDKLATI